MCPTLPQLQPTVVQAVRKAVKFGIRLVLPDFLVASVKAGAPVDPEVHRNGLQVGARRIARSADPAALHITILLRRFLLHYGLERCGCVHDAIWSTLVAVLKRPGCGL